jgi:hypothetical protein
VNRYLLLAFFSVVMGCADEGTKVAPALPEQGAPVANDEPAEREDSIAPPENDGPCAVSFTKDVMPKLSTTCGTASCHTEAIAPSIENETPQITYEALRDFGFDDAEWVDPHPNDSKLTEPSLKAAIDGWRACGAPFE